MNSNILSTCIKEPTTGLFQAWDALSQAVDAHLAGEVHLADRLFRNANSTAAWDWINPLWTSPYRNVVCKSPIGDTFLLPKDQRHTLRDPTKSTKMAVLKRDGYACRYCGVPVVDAQIRKIITRLYPEAVPWNPHIVNRQHAAFQCFWLQYDHVVPHSHGGTSTEENIVISCGLCNFGKDGYTLKQLGISDPRDRAPSLTDYDGLERIRKSLSEIPPVENAMGLTTGSVPTMAIAKVPTMEMTFFIPGARIVGNYVYTPEIQGKLRYFEIGPRVEAAMHSRDGVDGCTIKCDPKMFTKRGLNSAEFSMPDTRSLNPG